MIPSLKRLADDPFLNPSASLRNMDRFIVRSSILDAIYRYKDKFTGVCLDVGCGDSPYKSLLLSKPFRVSQYIGLDRASERCQSLTPDLFFINGTIPLLAHTIDSVLCTEVLEHCPDPAALLCEVCRVMRTGGMLVLTIPFVWPLHEVPNDFFRYTPFALQHLLQISGFEVQEIVPMGGWDKSLAQILGLWVRRRPMNRLLRIFLSLLIYPLWSFLRLLPEANAIFPSEGSMITGLVVLASRK